MTRKPNNQQTDLSKQKTTIQKQNMHTDIIMSRIYNTQYHTRIQTKVIGVADQTHKRKKNTNREQTHNETNDTNATQININNNMTLIRQTQTVIPTMHLKPTQALT